MAEDPNSLLYPSTFPHSTAQTFPGAEISETLPPGSVVAVVSGLTDAVGAEEVVPGRLGYRGGAGRDPQRAEDVGHVAVDGVLAEDDCPC